MKIYKIKLKKGDLVQVIRGSLKGQTGRITAVHPKLNQVTIDNLNIVKRHQKPNPAHPQGGIIEIVKPIDVSKVAIVEPTAKKPTRIGYSKDKDGKKIRIYKSTAKVIVSKLK